jgi:hypothetical protein
MSTIGVRRQIKMPNTQSSSSKVNLPIIHLDKTLADLYRQHCPSLANKRIGHIFCGTTCAASLSPDFPRNKKYVYQDSAFNDAGRSGKTDAEVQQILAPKYLSLVPQRDAFIAGDSPVFFFYSGREKVDMEHDESETQRTLAVLDEAQKPEVTFARGPSDVGAEMEKRHIDYLSNKLVVDGVVESAGSKMLASADLLWYLNSKEALARSGLPTPKATIIDVEGYCPWASNCCETCEEASLTGQTLVPEACTGPRKRWIGEQVIRILSAVEQQALPFVFKNQQTFGGAGTYVITKGPHRNKLIEELTYGGILRRMLSLVTPENVHLKPGTVLLTTMIKDPGADYGITFFVSESGSTAFLAASEQMIDRENAAWIGSNISYSHQAALQDKFGLLIGKIGQFLHKQGYIGPAGVDILETKSGDFQIVDLNVRTSGSLSLPLLRTHFTSRGFYSASSISVTVEKSRDEFCQQWRTEVEAGQLCILAWYEDQRAGKSYGDVVVGAKDEADLTKMLEKVRNVSEQVTF